MRCLIGLAGSGVELEPIHVSAVMSTHAHIPTHELRHTSAQAGGEGSPGPAVCLVLPNVPFAAQPRAKKGKKGMFLWLWRAVGSLPATPRLIS